MSLDFTYTRLNQWCGDFFPRDAMQARPMPSCGVHVSVCVSRSWTLSKRIHICIAWTMPWQDVRPSVRPSVCPSVCLSVCLSVRPSHADILSKRLYISSKFFSLSGSPTILVFRTKRDGNTPTRTPQRRRRIQGVWKKSRYSTNISLNLGIDARWSHCYSGRWIGNHTQAFEWYQFEWSWVTSNPDFKVTILFNVKYLKNGTR